MKKEERLGRLFGEIDDDLVAGAANRPLPIKVWLPRVTAAVAAVALTAGVMLTQPWANEKPPIFSDQTTGTTIQQQQNSPETDTNVPANTSPSVQDPTDTDTPPSVGGTPTHNADVPPEWWYERKWDEKPTWMKFPYFERSENGMYTVRETATVTADKVGAYLEDVNLHGYDVYTETAHEATGKIYRIESINPHCAVALQYPEENELFVAVCSKYSPATLGDLINDLSLRENLQVGTVYHSYRDKQGNIHDSRYSGLTVEKAWDLLMSDTTLPNVNEWQTEWTNKVSLSISVPLLGYHNISISLFAEGYMRTNLLDTEKNFFIGADKVDAFLAYVEENCRLEEGLIALPGNTVNNSTTKTSPAQKPAN